MWAKKAPIDRLIIEANIYSSFIIIAGISVFESSSAGLPLSQVEEVDGNNRFAEQVPELDLGNEKFP